MNFYWFSIYSHRFSIDFLLILYRCLLIFIELNLEPKTTQSPVGGALARPIESGLQIDFPIAGWLAGWLGPSPGRLGLAPALGRWASRARSRRSTSPCGRRGFTGRRTRTNARPPKPRRTHTTCGTTGTAFPSAW